MQLYAHNYLTLIREKTNTDVSINDLGKKLLTNSLEYEVVSRN